MPAEGGAPREVTTGDHNQGDPTWMPKGDSIVFAGMPWLENGSVSGPNIHSVNLETSQITDIPGSENLLVRAARQMGATLRRSRRTRRS